MCTVFALLDPEHCIIPASPTPNKVHLQLSGNSRNGGNFLYLTFCCHSEELLKTYTTCLKECPIKSVLFVPSTILLRAQIIIINVIIKLLHTNC